MNGVVRRKGWKLCHECDKTSSRWEHFDKGTRPSAEAIQRVQSIGELSTWESCQLVKTSRTKWRNISMNVFFSWRCRRPCPCRSDRCGGLFYAHKEIFTMTICSLLTRSDMNMVSFGRKMIILWRNKWTVAHMLFDLWRSNTSSFFTLSLNLPELLQKSIK